MSQRVFGGKHTHSVLIEIFFELSHSLFFQMKIVFWGNLERQTRITGTNIFEYTIIIINYVFVDPNSIFTQIILQ